MDQTYTYTHTHIHTYVCEFLTCSTVKRSLNQRHGQSLGGGD